MASLSNVDLRIEANTADLNKLDVTIEYDVNFDDFDRATEIGYRQRYVLLGVDDPAEGPIPEQLLRTFFGNVISAGGTSVLHQSQTFAVPRSALNEDLLAGQNPDELKVRCEIEPLLPQRRSRTSPVRKITII